MLRSRLVAAAALALMLAACDGPDADATGQQIFAEVCARCHSADLSGGVGPALGPGSNAASASDEYLVATITQGRGAMPSFQQTLTPEQIERVVTYLRQEQNES
ncbi:MAG TPA: cytochrome c [Acidimicrobiia bacterium]|nr:cytochrome c [Acidimicrobiia bacterium]